MRKSYKEMKKYVKENYCIGYLVPGPYDDIVRNTVIIIRKDGEILSKSDWSILKKIYRRESNSNNKFIGSKRYVLNSRKYPSKLEARRCTYFMDLKLLKEKLNLKEVDFYEDDCNRKIIIG